ncbi:ribosomal protein S18-alanine N-acetyltransferase [Desulfurivibrio sp. C05AmB]|uniref:ribosomal protein S18-alanine N-acetyltransferase n=1 Tax=Desulfurivibrio sp. C05AmB TaxID=3374371 RepID=UPI00376EF3BF
MELHVAPMTLADLPAVAALEAENPGAWTAVQLAGQLAESTGWHFVGRERAAGPVIAYVCGRLVLDEAEIFRLAVLAAHRRRGVGRHLLALALRELARRGARTCFLEVRAANRPVLALYEQSGFQALARRPGYYRDPLDDAVVMVNNGITEAPPGRSD